MKIGFWGVGLMGAPLARRLAEAGYAVLACSREMSKAMSAVGQKGTATTRREDLAECDILFTCLALPEHVRCAVAGPAGLYGRMASGSMHVECSTIDPALAESLEKEAAARGIAYVQATLGKTPQVAARGEAPMFVGGKTADKARIWPVLEAMGLPVDVGSIRASCAVKLVSNLVGMTNLAVLAEGMRLGREAGLPQDLLLRILMDSGARSFQLENRGPMMAQGDFTPRFLLRLAHKDMRLGCEMARQQQVFCPIMEEARAAYAAAEAQGLGEKDCAAVSELALTARETGKPGEDA